MKVVINVTFVIDVSEEVVDWTVQEDLQNQFLEGHATFDFDHRFELAEQVAGKIDRVTACSIIIMSES